MSFTPVTIPLLKGQDSNTAEGALPSEPQKLLSATNVVFSKTGSVRGRPGMTSQDAPVIAFDGVSSGAGLATPMGVYQPAGLQSDGTSVFLQMHGRMFKRTASSWIDMGYAMSFKRSKYASLTSYSVRDNGGGLFGDPTTPEFSSALDFGNGWCPAITGAPGFGGFTEFNTDGSVLGGWTGTAPTNTPQDQTGRGFTTAFNAIFWLDSTTRTSLYMQVKGTFPNPSAIFTLATDATANAFTKFNTQRVWAAWDGTNYYVAYVSGTTPNDSIKILKVSTTGSVVGTLTYTTTTTILSLCLAVDKNTGKGVLVYTTTVAPMARTEVFALSGMTNLSLSVTLTPTDTDTVVGAVVGIANGTAFLAYHGHPASVANKGYTTVDVRTRSLTTASSQNIVNYGSLPRPSLADINHTGTYGDLSLTCDAWQTMFPPTQVNGRVLLGVQHATRAAVPYDNTSYQQKTGPYTWHVVDLTDANGTTLRPTLATSGALGDVCAVSRAAVASVRNNALVFCVPQGISFNAFSIDTAALTPIALTPRVSQLANSGVHSLLGGDMLQMVDGNHVIETGWTEAPACRVDWVTTGPVQGFTAGASYTFAFVWTYTDSYGQVHRSPPQIFTSVNPAGDTARLWLGTPFMTNKYGFAAGQSFGSRVNCEIYGTGPNPPGTQALILRAVVAPNSNGTAASFDIRQGFQLSDGPSSQLYTTGGVLQDDRAPADRGVVCVSNRVWTADENTLYASHVRTPNVAPAFNTEAFFVNVPEVYGHVVGIGGLDDKVIGVCEKGVFVVTGPGLDDQGQGSGWSQPERLSFIGGLNNNYRTVVTGTNFVAFTGADGKVYLVTRDLNVQDAGDGVELESETVGDLVYVPSGRNIGWDTATNISLVYGTALLKRLDVESGQWAVWTGLTATSLTSAGGALYALQSGTPYVVAYTASGGQDLGVNFSMSIRLRPQDMGQPNVRSGWGRIRSINPVFKTLGDHTIRVQAYADEKQQLIVDKSFTVLV